MRRERARTLSPETKIPKNDFTMKKKKLPPFLANLTMAGQAATIDLQGIIGWDMEVSKFTDLVTQAKDAGCTELTLRINSAGGYCYDGLAMADALKNSGMRTRGVVTGTAQSMASYLLECCDVREANANATIMFHQPSAGIHGPVDELLEQAKYLCGMRDRMFEDMGKRCGMSGEDLSREHMTMKMYTAAQAKARGFLDVITGEEQADAPATDCGEPQEVEDPRKAMSMYGECNGVFDVAMQGEEEPEEPKAEETPEEEPKAEEPKQEEPQQEEPKQEEPKAEQQPTVTPEMQAAIEREVAARVAEATAKAEADAIAKMGVPVESVPGGKTAPAASGNKMNTEQFEKLPWYERVEALNQGRY